MKNYLDSWDKWYLPVFPVPKELNPFFEDRVELSVALMCHLPYGSHKFITVCGLILGAQRLGLLEGVHTLVEGTSGNTGIVLASIANYLGLRTTLVVPSDLPEGKRGPLTLTGAEIISAKPGLSAIATAREMGGGGWRSKNWCADKGVLNLDQYANPGGTQLHSQFTAPAILKRFNQFLPTVLVSPIGTSGMVIGVSNYLKERSENTKVWGVLCSPGQEIPGCRDQNRMKEIRLPWREALNDMTEIPTRSSYLASLWFSWVMGITPGPSSGFAYLGALKILARYKAGDRLKEISGRDDTIRVVILFPDGYNAYVDRFKAFVPTEFHSRLTAPMPWQFPGEELW